MPVILFILFLGRLKSIELSNFWAKIEEFFICRCWFSPKILRKFSENRTWCNRFQGWGNKTKYSNNNNLYRQKSIKFFFTKFSQSFWNLTLELSEDLDFSTDVPVVLVKNYIPKTRFPLPRPINCQPIFHHRLSLKKKRQKGEKKVWITEIDETGDGIFRRVRSRMFS